MKPLTLTAVITLLGITQLFADALPATSLADHWKIDSITGVRICHLPEGDHFSGKARTHVSTHPAHWKSLHESLKRIDAKEWFGGAPEKPKVSRLITLTTHDGREISMLAWDDVLRRQHKPVGAVLTFMDTLRAIEKESDEQRTQLKRLPIIQATVQMNHGMRFGTVGAGMISVGSQVRMDLNELIKKRHDIPILRFQAPDKEGAFGGALGFSTAMSCQVLSRMEGNKSLPAGYRLISEEGRSVQIIDVQTDSRKGKPTSYRITITQKADTFTEAIMILEGLDASE